MPSAENDENEEALRQMFGPAPRATGALLSLEQELAHLERRYRLIKEAEENE